ncbi:MAG TPA: hypothetical protein VK506_09755, partial [Conexibacter sp.]|nr:hypothetical protein [Conexibacter sp.]
DGPLDLSVAGLPAGVTAELLPDPVPGTQTAATLRLTASDTAPPFFVPAELTLTADPLLNALVAPAPRSVTIPITVRTNFELSRTSVGAVAIPQCAPADMPLRVNRDLAFATSRSVTLTAEGLPPGVTAEFLPSATVPPGGGLIAEPTLRLRRGMAGVPGGASVLVRAISPGAPQRTLVIPLANAAPTASLDATSSSGAVPSRLQPGTRIRMVGNGFCAGTKLRVGNALAETDADVEPDGTALAFSLPRLATSGVVTVVPPGGIGAYGTTNAITVRSPRNHTGFPFDNPSYDNLSLTELAELVGFDEMFVRVNPCWPFYDCSIPTGLPDPVAYLKWQIIEQVMQESGGHCFGINRTIQELGAGRIRLNRFASGLTRNFDMPSPSGPIGAFESYLDHRHAGQATGEFMLNYGLRSDSISSQLTRIRNELRAGRLPGVIVHNSFTEGHVVTAHDVETLIDGRTIVHTYDNERPFLPGEDTDTSGVTHRDRENGSQIVVNAAQTRWEYSSWSGGNDGSLYATLLTDFPANPSLPGVGEAIVGIFGSAGGAAVTSGRASGAEVVPVLDRNAVPGAAGFLIGERGADAISHVVRGRRRGAYSQLIAGRGFVGSVDGVRTARGVVDRVSGTPGARLLRFAGERARRITLNVGVEAGRARRSATIHTRTTASGSETVQLAGGRSLVYEHDGAATSWSFALSSAEPGAAAGSFASGRLTVRDGDRVTATPVRWRAPSSVRLSIRHADGRRETRRLRNRATGPSARISVTRLRVATARGRDVAQVTARLRRLRGSAVQGVVLRLTRGGRTVARRGFAVRRPRNGARTFRWRLPAGLAAGRYQLLADITVASTGARSGTRRVVRHASVRL